MFRMGIFLSAMCFGLEMYLVASHPWLLKFLAKHKNFGLGFSIALSFAMGYTFGAEGLTVMVAAVSSTLAAVAVYESGVLNRADEMRAKAHVLRGNVHEAAILTWKSVVFLWKVFTFPVRCIMWCSARYDSVRMVIRRIAP